MQAKAALERTERENKNDEIQAKNLNGELTGYRNRVESLAEKMKESQDEKAKVDRQFTKRARFYRLCTNCASSTHEIQIINTQACRTSEPPQLFSAVDRRHMSAQRVLRW